MNELFANERDYSNCFGVMLNNHLNGFINPLASIDGTLFRSQPLGHIYSNQIRNMIVDVNIIVPNKVVEVIFFGGNKQKAVCQEPDAFSLEQAISICISKHLLGGTSAYNKAVKKGIKIYEDKQKKEYAAKAEEDRITKKRAKRAAYKKRRDEKRREEQIEIRKEAYIRAIEK